MPTGDEAERLRETAEKMRPLRKLDAQSVKQIAKDMLEDMLTDTLTEPTELNEVNRELKQLNNSIAVLDKQIAELAATIDEHPSLREVSASQHIIGRTAGSVRPCQVASSRVLEKVLNGVPLANAFCGLCLREFELDLVACWERLVAGEFLKVEQRLSVGYSDSTAGGKALHIENDKAFEALRSDWTSANPRPSLVPLLASYRFLEDSEAHALVCDAVSSRFVSERFVDALRWLQRNCKNRFYAPGTSTGGQADKSQADLLLEVAANNANLLPINEMWFVHTHAQTLSEAWNEDIVIRRFDFSSFEEDVELIEYSRRIVALEIPAWYREKRPLVGEP